MQYAFFAEHDGHVTKREQRWSSGHFESILYSMRSIAPLLLFVYCSLAFAQLDSNSITVSASNNVTVQPDQAVFSVNVIAPLATGLDDVLTALAGSGITAANFSGVSTQPAICPQLPCPSPPMLAWLFTVTSPLANTKTTVASLTTLQQNIAKANNGLTLSFSIVGTQVSQQLAQSQSCSLSSLVTSATTQAQALAAAAGVQLGAILALSSSTSNVTSSSQLISSGAFISTIYNSSPPPCAITVKFNVTRD
jgi:uncharacterized protein YggE